MKTSLFGLENMAKASLRKGEPLSCYVLTYYTEPERLSTNKHSSLIQWVETNQSNFCIYPTNICISRLMILR
jgi:hypothetical protein